MIISIIEKLEAQQHLDSNEMEVVMQSIMTGEVADEVIEKFLILLNKKGIQETEITAAAKVMKLNSLQFDIGDGNHIDTCGTGGTGFIHLIVLLLLLL
jgi:anthranilate phosphoribosyltransferase